MTVVIPQGSGQQMATSVVAQPERALFVKRLMLFEPNVVLSSVPYVLDEAEDVVAAGGTR
ncbi:MAG: hypothetical protein U0V56_06185 [Actinomycetota bacterium]